VAQNKKIYLVDASLKIHEAEKRAIDEGQNNFYAILKNGEEVFVSYTKEFGINKYIAFDSKDLALLFIKN